MKTIIFTMVIIFHISLCVQGQNIDNPDSADKALELMYKKQINHAAVTSKKMARKYKRNGYYISQIGPTMEKQLENDLINEDAFYRLTYVFEDYIAQPLGSVEPIAVLCKWHGEYLEVWVCIAYDLMSIESPLKDRTHLNEEKSAAYNRMRLSSLINIDGLAP